MPEAGEGSVPPTVVSHPASLLAAHHPHPPGARPSLCPTPIAHAATKATLGRGILRGTPSLPLLIFFAGEAVQRR
jgi:hypothetical protein